MTDDHMTRDELVDQTVGLNSKIGLERILSKLSQIEGLDDEIKKLVRVQLNGNIDKWARDAGIHKSRAILDYLGSQDCALSLCPDGVEYSISTIDGVARVEMPLNGDDIIAVCRHDGDVITAIIECALLAHLAILRAVEIEKGEHG